VAGLANRNVQLGDRLAMTIGARKRRSIRALLMGMQRKSHLIVWELGQARMGERSLCTVMVGVAAVAGI